MKHPAFAAAVGVLCLCAQAAAALPPYEVSLQEFISPKDDIFSLADAQNPAKHAARGASPHLTGMGARKTQIIMGQTLSYCQTMPFARPDDPIPLAHKSVLLGPEMTVEIHPSAHALLDTRLSFHVTEWDGPPPKNLKNPPINPVLRTRGFAVNVLLASGETVRLCSMPTVIPGKDGEASRPAFATYFLSVTELTPPQKSAAQGAPERSRAEIILEREAQFARARNEDAAQWYFPEAEAPVPAAVPETSKMLPSQGYTREP